MKRKMTIVFNDEELYTQLKIEAVKKHITASQIVTEAVREWLEDQEDAELLPVIEAATKEWKEKGGRPWSEVGKEIAEAIKHRNISAERKRVSA